LKVDNPDRKAATDTHLNRSKTPAPAGSIHIAATQQLHNSVPVGFDENAQSEGDIEEEKDNGL
jgi:hypothetical protein